MKKYIISLTLILSLCFLFPSFADENIKLILKEQEIQFQDAQPFIDRNNRTLVPVRFISETLGCKVEWDAKNHTVLITGNSKEIKLPVGYNYAIVDGKKVEFDTKAVIVQNRTFVPLRFISEAFDANVVYNYENRQHVITIKLDNFNLNDDSFVEGVVSIDKAINNYDKADMTNIKKAKYVKDFTFKTNGTNVTNVKRMSGFLVVVSKENHCPTVGLIVDGKIFDSASMDASVLNDDGTYSIPYVGLEKENIDRAEFICFYGHNDDTMIIVKNPFKIQE
ncbi:copper amine oxidase N-terminal domain-containing protein [Tepidibacter hydrothermalis]|uniref:Copper amine oxidase N-terminal domain-containing protein n=1 Tax=Tepidibacter hydrothermalis TaxID=3036126 RepID=A0ABY8E7C2_9FIRM|nr:copper amine oxidase N-terminal domain-containing protein [Tepidibacter hydrothermalis]WFD08782.1 copper amine oxidase N-terminal domain-containing protein [Tepidibacter hydrothermalis]